MQLSLKEKVRNFIDFRLFVGIASVSGTPAQISQISLPLLVSALIAGLGLDERNAGLVVSVELLTVGLTAFCISPFVHRSPRRTLALIGATLAIAGHLLSVFAADMSLLIAVRVLAGIGAGMLIAVGNASVASSDNPDRMFSLVLIVIGASHLAILPTMPMFISRWLSRGPSWPLSSEPASSGSFHSPAACWRTR